MKYQYLGNTSMYVSQIGFGTIPIMTEKQLDNTLVKPRGLSITEAIDVLSYAYRRGINFFDTAEDYGDSEYKIGRFLKSIDRSDVYIASKSKATSYFDMCNAIEHSLASLATPYIDLYQFHYVKDTKTLHTILDRNTGALKALLEYQKKGIIRYIGCATHNQDVIKAAINIEPISTLQIPINLLEQQNAEYISLAHRKGIGIIGMKPLAGGVLTKPTMSVSNLQISDCQMRNLAIGYALLSESDVVIPGMDSHKQVDENIQALDCVDKGNIELLSQIMAKQQMNYCRRCQYCEPCTVGISISEVLRFLRYYIDYELHEWAKQQYKRLNISADRCINCQLCKSKCPYGIDIPNELARAHLCLTE